MKQNHFSHLSVSRFRPDGLNTYLAIHPLEVYTASCEVNVRKYAYYRCHIFQSISFSLNGQLALLAPVALVTKDNKTNQSLRDDSMERHFVDMVGMATLFCTIIVIVVFSECADCKRFSL